MTSIAPLNRPMFDRPLRRPSLSRTGRRSRDAPWLAGLPPNAGSRSTAFAVHRPLTVVAASGKPVAASGQFQMATDTLQSFTVPIPLQPRRSDVFPPIECGDVHDRDVWAVSPPTRGGGAGEATDQGLPCGGAKFVVLPMLAYRHVCRRIRGVSETRESAARPSFRPTGAVTAALSPATGSA